MKTYYDLFKGGDVPYSIVELIKKLRTSHLENGGDPVDFPQFLEDQGIKAIGPLLRVEDSATALATLLKD